MSFTLLAFQCLKMNLGRDIELGPGWRGQFI